MRPLSTDGAILILVLIVTNSLEALDNSIRILSIYLFVVVVFPEHRKPYKAQFDSAQIALMKQKREKEVKMFAILKEIGAYLIYLFIVTTLVYDSVDLNAFKTNDHIKDIFVKSKFTKVGSFITYV